MYGCTHADAQLPTEYNYYWLCKYYDKSYFFTVQCVAIFGLKMVTAIRIRHVKCGHFDNWLYAL